MGDIKQTNFRIDTESADAFRQFCEEHGMNQAQGFDHLIQVLELNRAKTGIEGRLTEITTFEEYVKKILEAYLNSLQIAQNTEERVREDFKTDISLRDKALADSERKIIERDDRIAQLTNLLNEAEKKAKEAVQNEENAVKQAESAIQIATEKGKVNDMLSAKLASAEEKLSGYDELKASEDLLNKQISDMQHNAELLQTKINHSEERYNATSVELKESKSLLDAANNTIQDLKMKIVTLERDIVEQKNLMEQRISEQIKEASQAQELAVEKAVILTERNLQEQINKLREDKARLEVTIEMSQKNNTDMGFDSDTEPDSQ